MFNRTAHSLAHDPLASGVKPLPLSRFVTAIATLLLISLAIQPGQTSTAATPEAASLAQPLR
jgi:hypothetical protein